MQEQDTAAVTERPTRRFIFKSWVAVEAATLEDANALMENIWEDDLSWHEFSDHVEVFAPGAEPDEVQEPDDGPSCICPPDMVARGGFKGGCPVHSSGAYR